MSAIQEPGGVTGVGQRDGDQVPAARTLIGSTSEKVEVTQPSASQRERVDPVAFRRITPFVRPQINPDQLPPDYLALLSLTFGVAGLMLKSTWASWASVFCCISSLGNMKTNETDPKQIGCSVLFACMGLFMNYFGPARSRPMA